MGNKNFESIEQEVIYNKLVGYLNDDSKNIVAKFDISNDAINIMKENKDVFAHRMIKSHRRILGSVIIFLKKVMRRCLKWYINPITEQQTVFNNAITEFAEEILGNLHQSDRIDNLENQLKRIDNLENQLKRINNLENQLKRIENLENQIHKINCVDEKIRKIDEKFDLNLYKNDTFFEKTTYAQSGEDSIISYILFALGINIEKITYLDLGANHAKKLSNTYHFYKNGGHGVLVEANPDLVQELSLYRHNDVILNSLVGITENEELEFYILSGDGLSTPDKQEALKTCQINPNIYIEKTIKIKSVTVNTIIEEYFAGIAPHIISIDIEGKDLEVLKSINLDKYRPLIMSIETIEYRPYLSINIKSNEVAEYLQSKGYIEYAFTGINSIFIDADYMRKIGQEG